MIIEANTLAYDLRGVSIFERVIINKLLDTLCIYLYFGSIYNKNR